VTFMATSEAKTLAMLASYWASGSSRSMARAAR